MPIDPARFIRRGDDIVAGQACAEPQTLMEALVAQRAAFSGAQLYLDTHLTYDWFFDELNFHVDRYRVESFRDQWELGLALGGGGRPLEFGFLSFDHVGLAYRWSSNGNFEAITLNFSSPFMD